MTGWCRAGWTLTAVLAAAPALAAEAAVAVPAGLGEVTYPSAFALAAVLIHREIAALVKGGIPLTITVRRDPPPRP